VEPIPSRPGLRLAAFYAAIFGTVGVSVTFFPIWLESRGLTPEDIALVVAAGLWIRIVSTPLAAGIADRTGRSRDVMVVLAGISLVAHIAYAGVAAPFAFMLVSAASAGTSSPLVPIADALAVRSGVDYGRVRLWGSIAFIVASVGIGAILTAAPKGAILLAIIVGFVAIFASTLVAPQPPPAPRPAAARGGGLDLLRRPAFLLFLATTGAVHASHATYYTFGSLHWTSAGHSETVIGLLWAEGVLAEVALFFIGRRLTEIFRPSWLLAIGGAAAALRWTVLAGTSSLPILVAAQALHGLTFGASHLGAITFLARRVPSHLAATAQSYYSVAVTGVALGLATPLAGRWYAAWQGDAYLVSAALGALAALLAVALRFTPDSDDRGRLTAP
jgi:PPP family 3-phenylpropionic acid transporter